MNCRLPVCGFRVFSSLEQCKVVPHSGSIFDLYDFGCDVFKGFLLTATLFS